MTPAGRAWRLLPAVVCAWVLAVALTRASVAVGLAVAAVCLVMAAAGAWRWRGDPGLVPVAVATAGAAGALVAVSAALHVAVAHAHPWPDLVTSRAAVTATVEVLEAGRPIDRPAGWDGVGGDQRTTARVVQLAVGEQWWRLGSRVRLEARQGPGGELLVPGQVVGGRMRVSPAEGPGGVSATLTGIDPTLTVHSTPDGPSQQVRERFRAALAHPSPAQAELVLGMVLGDDELLPEPVKAAMKAAGLTHLTAVSGANIAIVTGLVLWLARLVGVPLRWAVPPTLLVLAGYVALVGPEPSVVRATAMALIALAALVLGGGNGLAALLAAILALLVVDPWLAGSRGFALSCAATAGLILAAAPGRAVVQRVSAAAPPGLRGLAAVGTAAGLTALAAALATAPLLAAYGQGISWISVAANVAAAPMVPVVTVSGLGVAALGWVWPAAAQVAAVVPAAGAGWIIEVAHWAAAVPGGRVPWPAGWLWAGVLAAVVGAVVLAGRRWRWLPIGVPATVAAISLTAATAPTALNSLPPDWQMIFCDVGQGDAALLRAGPRSAVLVDAGPDPEAAQACLSRSGISDVPVIVLSHFHRDHVAGLAAVLAASQPQQVLVSPLSAPEDTHASTARELAEAGVAPTVPRVGQRFTIGWASWTITGPARVPGDGSPPNNASLTFTATVDHDGRRATAFFGGDLEPEGQQVVMAAGQPIDVDVVKVPHHGSANQHPRLPTWTGAEVAVISCGADNDYGHPSPLTVASWQGAGAAVVRTDTAGDVIVAGRVDAPPALLTRTVAAAQ